MNKNVHNIYVEIDKGCLSGIYGEQIPTDIQINFVLRDMDNINAGDEDPLDKSIDLVYYW